MIRKASFNPGRFRALLAGPTSSGKTVWALEIASALGRKICVVDSEFGESEMYAGQYQFDIIEVEKIANNVEKPYAPKVFSRAIKEAKSKDYDVLIVDTVTKEWTGEGGALELKDQAEQAMANSGWRIVTPMHNEFVGLMLSYPGIVIATVRVKDTVSIIRDETTGKTKVEKLPFAYIQRPGFAYEWKFVAEIESDHKLHITKAKGEHGTKLVENNGGRGFKGIGELLPILGGYVNGVKKGKK